MRKFLTIQITALFMFALGCGPSYGQVDTICIQNNTHQVNNLVEGTSQYLSWFRNTKTGQASYISVSERKVSFQKRKGSDVVVITKRLLNDDTSRNRYVFIICNRSDFRTVFDYSKKSNTIEAYDFHGNEITAADTVKLNSKFGFHFRFNEIPYNNELDLETISIVPVKKVGQQMAIRFYQPGNTSMNPVRALNVIDNELINGINNVSVDCWVLKLVFDSDNYDLFWVSKKKHEVLKFESWGPDGVYSKIKLFSSGQNF